MEMRNIEYGILVTNGDHTYQEATFLTLERAVEDAAVTATLVGHGTDIVTVVRREVRVTLGDWQEPGL